MSHSPVPNQPTPPIQHHTITLPKPLFSASTSQLLQYQWVIFTTLVILFLSSLQYDLRNLRIILYCILFLLLQTTRTTSKLLESQDPLQLSPARKLSRQLSILLQVNLTYLLFRILITHHNLFSFLLFLHYSVVGVMNFQKSRKNYQIHLLNQGNNTIYKLITPFVLFFLSKVISLNSINQLSILQLILLAFNLLLSQEIKLLLTNKECYFFGWERNQIKRHLSFSKYLAVKRIMFALCAAVALQNLLFVLPTVGHSATFTMLFSLVLGGYVFAVYRKMSRK